MIERPCMNYAECNSYVVPPASRCARCLNEQRRNRRNPGYDDPRYRRRRRALRGKVCERCHRRPAEQVHHKDGNPSNNVPSNWEDLCEHCHRTADRDRRKGV